MIRLDLRKSGDIRDLDCEIGHLQEANGSAKLSCGKTVVLASCYGPATPKFSRLENFEKGTLDIDFSIAGCGQSNQQSEKKLAEFLKHVIVSAVCLEEYPRLTIFLKLLVMNDDGSAIAAAVNSATLAIMNAGIKMNFTPCAVCLNMTPDDGPILVDPTAEETNASEGSEFALVFNNSRTVQNLVAFFGEGKFRNLKDVVSVGASAATIYLQFMQASTA